VAQFAHCEYSWRCRSCNTGDGDVSCRERSRKLSCCSAAIHLGIHGGWTQSNPEGSVAGILAIRVGSGDDGSLANGQDFWKVGALKYSFQKNDHDGWVSLDGRTLASLPPSQRAQANSLGIYTILPKAMGRAIKMSSTTALGQTGGLAVNNEVSLNQANLPADPFLVTVATGGKHRHALSVVFFPALESGAASQPMAVAVNGYSGVTSPAATSFATDHTHAFSINTADSGWNGNPFSVTNAWFGAQVFLFLGAP
jgi:hypothetical protein